MWELEVRDHFSAAHALRNYNGKCERLHGHNFMVAVQVAGCELDPSTGMLIDFKILKDALKAILSELDHAFLNERSPFERDNPSSENIAHYIYNKFVNWLAASDEPQAAKVHVKRVIVSEKDTQSAAYIS